MIGFWRGFCRLIITLVTVGVAFLPYLLVDEIESLVLLFFVRSVIPGILAGIYMFWGLKYLLVKLNLANSPEMFLEVQNNQRMKQA